MSDHRDLGFYQFTSVGRPFDPYSQRQLRREMPLCGGAGPYRSRYFTDSGIIGTKEFVSANYQRFKDIFMSKREKIPKAVTGLDGVYSLKRLSD